MASGVSGSLYDLAGNLIEDTYPRLVQAIPSSSGCTPDLYDGAGARITGVKFQEAFERDENQDLQPTVGAFYDTFWEEDEDGNKMPRDIKFWLDADYNLIPLPNS